MISPVEIDLTTATMLAAPNESKGVEYKGSFPWPSSAGDLRNNFTAQSVVRSILAMSNLKDGGIIVFGVYLDRSKEVHVVTGMDSAHIDSYDQEMIYDQVKNFGEPTPSFDIRHVVSPDGKHFFKMNISGMMSAPVICQIPGRDKSVYRELEQSAIYIRTDKPESKCVREPLEMREIINVAVDREIAIFTPRLMNAFAALGVASKGPAVPSTGPFDSEIKDIKGIQ